MLLIFFSFVFKLLFEILKIPYNKKTHKPPPHPPTKLLDDLCGICNLEVKFEDKGIVCDRCNKWVHIKCTKVSDIEYEHYQINPEENFVCKKCKKCGVCDKTIASNHRKLSCSLCVKYVHLKCNKFDKNDHEYYQKNKHLDFYCINCLHDNLPLVSLKDNEFKLTIDGIKFTEETDVEAILF